MARAEPVAVLVPGESPFGLWLSDPQSWLGLYKIVRPLANFSLWLCLFLLVAWERIWKEEKSK